MKLSKTTLIQLAIIVAVVTTYFTVDFNQLYIKLRGAGEFTLQDKNCDLHVTPCEITIKDGTSFTLDITPKDIPLMENITFKVKSSNANFDDLKIRIYATNMMMGEFELPLKNMGNGNYETTVFLPTCPVGDMKWNADIERGTLTKLIGARFQFETDI